MAANYWTSTKKPGSTSTGTAGGTAPVPQSGWAGSVTPSTSTGAAGGTAPLPEVGWNGSITPSTNTGQRAGVAAPQPAAPYAAPTDTWKDYSQNPDLNKTVNPAFGDIISTVGNAASAPGVSGSQSGPGILEQWFNERANGTDPGYEYAMGRGMDAIDNRMAAGGSYNSGARGQQLSDFASNMGAQREGQLDALAGGASGEHQGRINSLFSQMLGLAGGQAGTMGQYDLASANSNNALMNAIVQMMGAKAGVDSKANQGLINTGLGALGLVL